MLWIALTFAAEPTWELSQSLEGAPSYGDKTRCMTWQAEVEADADALYELVADLPGWPSWMEEVQKAEIVEQEEDRLVIDYAEGTKLYSMQTRNEVRLDPQARVVLMQSLPDQDPASWMRTQVKQLDGGKARFAQASCFDAAFIPDWVLRSMAQSAAKELPARIEKGLEQRK